MLRHLLGADWTPDKVVFPHACKGRRTAYEDWFQAPVAFGSGSQVRIHMQRALSPDRSARAQSPADTRRDGRHGQRRDIRLGASDTRRAVERIIRSSCRKGR